MNIDTHILARLIAFCLFVISVLLLANAMQFVACYYLEG